MKIFSEKHQELKDFEEVILDIEKERDTLDECRASIQSCLWNLESPKIEQFDKDWFVKDLRENLNKKEKALAKLEYLKHSKLRAEMFRLNITTTPDRFLDWLDDMKKQKGIKNILVEGGGTTNWAFVKENLVDEVIITITPYLVGGMHATTLVDGDGFSTITKSIKLKLKNITKIKNEVVLHYEN